MKTRCLEGQERICPEEGVQHIVHGKEVVSHDSNGFGLNNWLADQNKVEKMNTYLTKVKLEK